MPSGHTAEPVSVTPDACRFPLYIASILHSRLSLLCREDMRMQNYPTLPSRNPPPILPGKKGSAAQNPLARLRSARFRTKTIVGGVSVGIIVCCCIGAAVIDSASGGATATPTATSAQVAGGLTATATAKPTATPKPTPTDTVESQPTCIPGAVNCNPWGYNFSPGNLIYTPPAGFCSYFTCISSFGNGSGYIVQCQDDMFSKSGGKQGSCSRHGGDKRPLYSH
jgi:hypothetical protein